MIRIGCAGWAIAARQSALFGPGDSVLARYATRFDGVEVNSTFHRSHRPATSARSASKLLQSESHPTRCTWAGVSPSSRAIRAIVRASSSWRAGSHSANSSDRISRRAVM